MSSTDEHFGLSYYFINEYETVDKNSPGFETVKAVCYALGRNTTGLSSL
jgi:hypothetical protein